MRSFVDLQNAVRLHEPGQAVRFRVERVGGRIEEIVLTRPRPVQAL